MDGSGTIDISKLLNFDTVFDSDILQAASMSINQCEINRASLYDMSRSANNSQL